MIKLIGGIDGNHQGKVSKALDIIKKFKFLDGIKIQVMEPKVFFSPQSYKANGKEFEDLQLKPRDLKDIKSAVNDAGQIFGISVCDVPSFEAALKVEPDFIKVPSFRCLNMPLLNQINQKWTGQSYVSTGLTSRENRNQLINSSFRLNLLTSNYTENWCLSPFYQGLSCRTQNPLPGLAAIINRSEYLEYKIKLDNSSARESEISLTPAEYEKLADFREENKDWVEKIKQQKGPQSPPEAQKFKDQFWSTQDFVLDVSKKKESVKKDDQEIIKEENTVEPGLESDTGE